VNRPSSLDVARFCGLAPKLNAQYGSERSATMSTAFHALCAEAPEARQKFEALTEDEREEITTWHRPANVQLPDGTILRYSEADREMVVGLDRNLIGFTAATSDALAKNPAIVTAGTLDMAWAVNGVAYVGDIKKSAFTVDGPDTLQLAAYAFAYASLKGCHTFVRGLWIAEEGQWLWEAEPVALDSVRAFELGGSVLFAAQNNGEASRGSHCRKCYPRIHCPEYLASASSFKACSNPASLTDQEAVEELIRAKSAKEQAELAEENIKALARFRRGIKDGKGKVYLPVVQDGRKTLDKPALEKKFGPLEGFMKQGKSFEAFRWVKAS
jgi:hypothetical protein